MTAKKLDHDLTHEQRTMVMTLRMHARDAMSSAPILGDRFAGDVLTRLGERVNAFDTARPLRPGHADVLRHPIPMS